MHLGARTPGSPVPSFEGAHDPPTPVIDQGAIGWSLTGTMNAPKNASLAVLYPHNKREVTATPVHPQLISNPPPSQATMIPPFPRQSSGPPTNLPNPPPPLNFNAPSLDPSRIQDAEMLLNLTHSPYDQSSPQQLPNPGIPPPSHLSNQQPNPTYMEQSHAVMSQQQQQQQEYQRMQEQGGMQYNNMMIESQDIDMSVLGDNMMWLEYLPSEPLNGFYGGGHGV